MSIIQAAGSGEVSTGFYNLLLDQSLKFDDGKASVLKRTPASAGNRRTWTWSAWVKFGAMSHGSGQITLFDASSSSSEQHGIVYSGQQFYVFGYTSGFTYRKMLNALHRDPSAWYHYVVAFDTTDGTAGDRIKIYVNGTLQTSFAHSTNPDQNYDTGFNNAVAHGLGARLYDGANYFDGYIAEVNMIDGTALTAASFGETKDGIWIPKDTSGLTFGTNGFHLTFKDDVVSEGFNAVTYTGNDSANSISGIGFSPAFVWLKQRNQAENHFLTDSVRGAGLHLRSDATTAESDTSATFTSFDGDGFSLTGSGSAAPQINDDGDIYVGWCWEAGGTPTADNSAGAGATPTAGSVKIDGSNLGSALGGSIAATRLSANTSKGFSVVTYTGTGSAATVAHGLGATPKWMIIKNRGVATWWTVYHTSLGATKYVRLNSTSAEIDNSNVWNDTEPTSSVFTVATVNDVNASGNTYVAYCWTDISGYSKFGSYTGNGSATGPSVTLGFTPAWIMLKRSDGGSEDWNIHDNTRSPSNPITARLFADLTTAETTSSGYAIDFNSNGFQLKGTDGGSNADGATYLYMAFADTREAAFFKDVTTNGNNFTPVNLDYRDSVPDTPTNNFATLNPLDAYNTGGVFSEGNLKWTIGGADGASRSTHVMTAGKWYVEFLSNNDYIGVVSGNASIVDMNGTQTVYYAQDGTKRVNGSSSSYGASYADGDIIGIALDLDSGTQTVTFYKNNASQGSLNLTDVGNEGYSVSCGSGSGSTNATANFGQDSSFSGAKATSNANADGNGHGSFAYAPPSGFLALCSQNLPDAAIIDGADNFNTVLYTGTGSTRSVTGVGFEPDWVWLKDRTSGYDHHLFDSVRGGGNSLYSNDTVVENTYATDITFASDGFSIADGGSVPQVYINKNNDSFVSWNWLAGTAFSNDASATGVGTIDSSGQVNETAGFSIVKYTGLGNTDQQTISVGLSWSGKDKLVIIKNRDASTNWLVNSSLLAANKVLRLNTTDNDSQVNSSGYITYETFGFKTYNGSNILNLANDYIAYCFHSVEGYSKIGTYVGNGNADGPFVHTGFRPAFWLMKSLSDATHWVIYDSVRETFNAVDLQLLPNETNAEAASSRPVDFLSNGVKIRFSSYLNDSGQTYIYLAFAEQPFKFSNAR